MRSSQLSSAELQLQHDIVLAWSTYETDFVTKFAFSNDSRIYQYIRNLSGQRNLPTVLHHRSAMSTSRAEKAELLNYFFHSVFNVSSGTLQLDTSVCPEGSLSSINISLSYTFIGLASLDPSKAMGGDGIPPAILKHSATVLAEPVHHLFSLCLSQEYLPDEWHQHHIIAIPKSGDRSQVSNYRPISLLCCLSKVLERLVFDKVSEFLVTSSVSLSQFGFIKNCSTLQQLLLYTENLIRASDRHHQVNSVYLDISKVFDTVSHNKILIKLWEAGISGNLWKFFVAYLSGRSQCVVVDGFQSGWRPMTSGVPQGSILAPLLFVIYINDLPSHLPSLQALLFADDTKCFWHIIHPSDSSLLQADLDQLFHWSSLNCLSFNASKCHLLRFLNGCTSPVSTTYHLNGVPIASSDQCKDLGVIFSNNLYWSHHYDMITREVYCKLGLIRHTFSSTVPVKVKKLLYLSLVLSKLTYCSQVWRPRLVKDFTFIERIQRRATKFILDDCSSNYWDRLISLNLLPLMYVFELSDIMFFIKCLKFPDPSFPVLDYVSFSSANTRSSSFSK